MNLIIRGDKLVVTEAIETYTKKRLEKLDKYFKNKDDVKATVVLKVRGIMQIVEVTITINKTILRAEKEDKDLYASIDLVIEKLERQIRKNKTKMSMKHKSKTIDFNLDFELSDDDAEDDKPIIKRKVLDTDPMSEEEAILMMNMLDHDFFIFKNSNSSSNVSVLYKRRDGNYGIIETK